MSSGLFKLSAAAVVIIAAAAAMNYFGGSMNATSIAVADVVRPLLTAESGSFKMTVDLASIGVDWVDSSEPLQTVEVVFVGPDRTRWDMPAGEVLVANFQEGTVMILMPAKKHASVMQVSPPGVIPPYNRFNQLLAIRPLIEYALETEDESVEFLGERQIQGVTAVGYDMAGPAHHGDITVWADVESRLPVWVERRMKEQKQTIIISDIAYDIELDESLFSVEPPEGYVVATSGQEEPDFVIAGTVTDAATGEPISGASVSDDGYGPKPYRGATTDAQGAYHYVTWPEEHTIVAQAPGYKPQRKALATGALHTANQTEQVIDFALERE
ncbi:MAG: carboxypeptidase regulatory-like domain-containing protein [Phycisphaerales bacterium]|nr:MAG: carboxypeptidase regulatory-like domain-containing protein [Phycisphaerales bacterium]